MYAYKFFQETVVNFQNKQAPLIPGRHMWLTKGTISSFQSSKEKEVVLKKISPGFDSYLLTQRVKLKLIKSTNLIYQVKPAGPQAVPHTLAEKELTEKGCQPESQPASLILKAKFTQK